MIILNKRVNALQNTEVKVSLTFDLHAFVEALKSGGYVDKDGNVTEKGLKLRKEMKDFYGVNDEK